MGTSSEEPVHQLHSDAEMLNIRPTRKKSARCCYVYSIQNAQNIAKTVSCSIGVTGKARHVLGRHTDS